ncbi:MAG: ROK family transcriptional regulator [Acidimicrobiales bacterium]
MSLPGLDRHALVRRANEQAVLRAMSLHGPITRHRLAELTGLSKPTVLGLVTALEEAGLIRAGAAQRNGSPGRSPVMFEPDPQAGLVVGIDLGGSKVRAALADLNGDVLAEETMVTSRHGPGAAVVGQLATIAKGLTLRAGVPWRKVRAVAVGSPGVVQPGGRLALAENVAGLGEVRLGQELKRALRTPVIVENDVNLAALAEHASGVATHCQTFAALAVGTGVGLGLVVNGELFRGRHGAAGEIGFLPLGADPALVESRRRGALETAASGPAITAALRHALDGRPSSLLEVDSTVEDIFAAAATGDEIATMIVADEARLLAWAILSVAAIIDPELVVLCGGVGTNPHLLAPVRAAVERIAPFPIEVTASALGTRGGVVGAITLARRHARAALFDGSAIS